MSFPIRKFRFRLFHLLSGPGLIYHPSRFSANRHQWPPWSMMISSIDISLSWLWLVEDGRTSCVHTWLSRKLICAAFMPRRSPAPVTQLNSFPPGWMSLLCLADSLYSLLTLIQHLNSQRMELRSCLLPWSPFCAHDQQCPGGLRETALIHLFVFTQGCSFKAQCPLVSSSSVPTSGGWPVTFPLPLWSRGQPGRGRESSP